MSVKDLPSVWEELLSWLFGATFLLVGLGSLFLGGFLSWGETSLGEPVLKSVNPIFWVLITNMLISGGLFIFYGSFFKPELLKSESFFLYPEGFFIGGATSILIAVFEILSGAGLSAAFWVAIILGAFLISFGYWIRSKEKP